MLAFVFFAVVCSHSVTQTEKVKMDSTSVVGCLLQLVSPASAKTASTGLQWVSLEMNGKRWVFLRHVHAHFEDRDGKHQCRTP